MLGELFDARAFALGMVALVNPCGFALLPAYLGFFLGLDEEDDNKSRIVALNRAQVVGLSMSVGFLGVFGVLGLFFASFIGTISGALPWVTLVMGAGLVVLGVAMLRGFQPMLNIPKLQKGGGSKSVVSMFLFGVSYAVASLTCTIGLFLSAVGTSGTGLSFGSRFGSFLSYGAGMGLLATGLTLAVAFGKQGIVTNMRSLLPKINLVSAVVLVVVGAYVAWYGYWSTDPINNIAGPVIWVEEQQAALTGWIDGTQPFFGWSFGRTPALGWGFFGINAALALAGLVARQASSANSEPSEKVA